MPEGRTLTIRLRPEVEKDLSRLAARTHRSPDTLVAEAIEAYVAREEQDVSRIEAGLAGAATATLIPHDQAMDELDTVISGLRIPTNGL